MWRQIALPVIVVGLSWLTVSGLTTFYMYWLDASYEKVFNENISSIHAASMLDQAIWRLHAEVVSGRTTSVQWAAQAKEFQKEVDEWIGILIARASTSEERKVARSLDGCTRDYMRELESVIAAPAPDPEQATARQDKLFALAAQISDGADRIRQINDELLQSSATRRDRITTAVMWARGFAITVVPILGIVLGWWTANRLQRSVAKIQVTLHDPSLAEPGNLGTVEVASGNELASIQKQVQLVVDRLRRTGEELQAAQRDVLRAERLAAIGGLAAGVAHELRNPLTSVKLLLQHAGSRGGDAVIAAQRLGLILDEVERMEGTIQGLLDFSRPAEPQRKLHDVRQTLERAVHLVEGRAEKQRVVTRVKLGSEPMLVNGDPQQLHQVFVNLLINAIEAMPEGGELTVQLSRDARARQLVIRISDTGVGIPPELMPRLFEPFATGKERGTGLGLAVSRRILQEHGGSIAASLQSPRGSLFEVILPAAKTPAPVVEQPEPVAYL